jgi:hypothetical protein
MLAGMFSSKLPAKIYENRKKHHKKKTHYSISNNVMWGIPYVCRKKKAQA